MLSQKIKYSVVALAVFCSSSLLTASELPKEKEEGEVLESIFIGSFKKSKEVVVEKIKVQDQSPFLSAGKKPKRGHMREDEPLGKGDSLSEEEINLSLLTFAKEEEARKKAIIEEKKRKRQEEENIAGQKMVRIQDMVGGGGMPMPQAQNISLAEQKERVRAGLPQFPNGSELVGGAMDATNGIVPQSNDAIEEVIEVVAPLRISFYGASCVSGECVVLSEKGTNRVGDTIGNNEKILTITRAKMTTDKREIVFSDATVPPLSVSVK